MSELERCNHGGNLRWKFDGGRGAMLCEFCDRIVGYWNPPQDERPPLSEATRERLVQLIGEALDADPDVALVADAILVEFRPVASTRERIIEALTRGDTSGDTYWWSDQEARSIAEALFEAGAVEDSAEVARAAAEKASREHE